MDIQPTPRSPATPFAPTHPQSTAATNEPSFVQAARGLGRAAADKQRGPSINALIISRCGQPLQLQLRQLGSSFRQAALPVMAAQQAYRQQLAADNSNMGSPKCFLHLMHWFTPACFVMHSWLYKMVLDAWHCPMSPIVYTIQLRNCTGADSVG